jgi:Tfp pilus tip-associated adhesin PilY1
MEKTVRFFMLGLMIFILALGIMMTNVLAEEEEEPPIEGEEALFMAPQAPDALLLLDLSGSMLWNPAGGDDTTGNADCTNLSSGSTNCSRLGIAKRAIFKVLDEDGNGTINSADEASLNVRFGYMRYYNCGDSSSERTPTYSYTGGCNTIRKYINTGYASIFCNSNKSTTNPNPSCTISSTCSGANCINSESAVGGTPLAVALHEAKMYLNDHKNGTGAAPNNVADPYKDCRNKYVILITDGSDTYACSGSGAECQEHQYKRRLAVVAEAKALADAGYKVFVIGFGTAMPDYLENTLNWTAYYGGTDNPDVDNVGSTSGYDPTGVNSCTTVTTAQSATCYDDISPGHHTTSNFKLSTNDPGYASLSGYAFLATSAAELGQALKTAITLIRQSNYSFTQASIQSTRTADENYLYEGSFEPRTGDPFWYGHLKKYQLDENGEVGTTALWDAGAVLQTTSTTSRVIKTWKNGSLVSFNAGTAYIKPTDLGFATDTASADITKRDEVVGYIRGETTYNPEQAVVNSTTVTWKLGDVFRSTPITVGTPSEFFFDFRDANKRFNTFRNDHQRSSSDGTRLIVSGANDGQFHAFRTGTGAEAWSFVPPNLLTKLYLLTHKAHPVAKEHQYFVDGPVTVADVWLGTGSGLAKEVDTWKTILIFAEGRGAIGYGWSSSSSCDTGISSTYLADDTYKYYCGYHALNVTDTLNYPSYLWSISFNNATRTVQAPYMGDPWSKMMVGRVRINVGGVDTEKWVGFIGAGDNTAECPSTGCASDSSRQGKGFFIVDLTDGKVLWSFTNGATNSATTNTAMQYSLPGAPFIVDTDNDSFIDTAYIGDLGGNIWRFKFCLASDLPNCAISGQTKNWNGGLFFDSPTANKIYTSPTVAVDTIGDLWVYWGTGDKKAPTATASQDYFYALKDKDRTSTYTLDDIDQTINRNDGTVYRNKDLSGWRIPLGGTGWTGEKMLADPTIFGGVVYLTTFTPDSANTLCEQTGRATLFGFDYTTGAGMFNGSRTHDLGSGMPSMAVVSVRPGRTGQGDIHVTTSSADAENAEAAHTQRVDFNPPGLANRTNMLYWRDMRLQ